MKNKTILMVVIIIFAVGLALFVIYLLNSNREGSKIVVNLNEEFTLQKNQIVYFKQDNREIQIKLDRIIDNSCPKGVTCVWEGEFIASVTINNEKYELGTLSMSNRIYTSSIKDTFYHINLIDGRYKNEVTFTITESSKEDKN